MERLLQDLHYAVRTRTTQKGLMLVVVLTLALAVVASLVPALRAARIDPIITTLRYE